MSGNTEQPVGNGQSLAAPSSDFVASLQRLEQTCLPADLKKQLLAELPPPEERERLYRELQEKGGLSFEEFFDSVCPNIEPQSLPPGR